MHNNLKNCSCNVWEVEVKVTLRPTVNRPVSLGVRRPSGTRDQFYFLLEMFFRQLRFCNFVAPSLTRGRVCNLQYNCFWALPEQSFLCRSPAELTAVFYSFIWDSPNLKGQVPVFKFPRNRVAQLYPRALGLTCGGSSSSCGWQSVDQFIWVSGLPLGPLTRFYLANYFILLSVASSLTRKGVCSLQFTCEKTNLCPYIKQVFRIAQHLD
jgi:hypothetical protein